MSITVYIYICIAVIGSVILLRKVPTSVYSSFEKPLQVIGGIVVVISIILGYLTYRNDMKDRAVQNRINYTELDQRYIIDIEKMCVEFPEFERAYQILNGEDVDIEKNPLTKEEKEASYHLCGIYYQIIEDVLHVGLVKRDNEKSDYGWKNLFYLWIQTDMFKLYHKLSRDYFLKTTADYIDWVIGSDLNPPDTGDTPEDYYKYFRTKNQI